jgi:hypothetical protein
VATAHKDYSGTPLPKKLGIREGSRVLIVGAPGGFEDLLAPLPAGVHRLRRAGADVDVALVFATRAADLRRRVPALARALAPDGRLWLTWPKKAAKIETDLTFDVVQGLGLDAGLVDNKSASITDVFQGLQFVYRLRDRPARR